MTAGEALRQARKKRGLKQTELSEMTGIQQNLISLYENNCMFPRLDAAIMLADCLEASMQECFTGEKAEYSSEPVTLDKIAHSMRKSRQSKNIRGYQFAKKIGVCNNTIYRFENGLTTPSLKIVIDASRELGITIDEYIGRV